MSPRRPATVFLAAACLAAVLALGGCGTDDTDTRAETAGVPLLREHAEAHRWSLDVDGSTPVIEGAEGVVTLELRDDAASGQGPCNTYRATLSIDGDDLTISDVGTTMRACEPPAMAADGAYIAALEAVTTGDVDGDRLVLTGPDDIRLVFSEHVDDDGDDDDAAGAAPGNLTTRENHR